MQDFIENVEDEHTIVIQDINIIRLNGEITRNKHELQNQKYVLGQVRYDNEIFAPEVSCKLYYKYIIDRENIRFSTDMVLGEDDKFFLDYLKNISCLKTLSVAHYNYIHREGSASHQRYDYQVYLKAMDIFNDLIDAKLTLENHKNKDIKIRYSKSLYSMVERVMAMPISDEEKENIFRKNIQNIRAEMFVSDKKKLEFLFLFYRMKFFKTFIYLWKKINR